MSTTIFDKRTASRLCEPSEPKQLHLAASAAVAAGASQSVGPLATSIILGGRSRWGFARRVFTPLVATALAGATVSPFTGRRGCGRANAGRPYLDWLVAFLFLTLALQAAIHGPVQAEGTGVAQGAVMNGTAGGLAAGVPVTVQIFDKMNQIDEKKVLTDADGHFRVEGLPAGANNRYIVFALYEGVKYSLKEAISPNAAGDPVAITIYGKTEAASDIVIFSASVAVTSIDASSGLLRVLEVMTVHNVGNRAFVGNLLANPDQGGVLRVPLVGAGLDLELGDGFGPEGALATPLRMITRTPIPPGQTVLVFDYKVPYDHRTIDLTRSFDYPVANASFVIGQGAAKSASAQLTSAQSVKIDTLPSTVLTGKNFAPGQAITVTLSALPPVKGSPKSGDTIIRIAGVAAAVLALGGIVVYILLRRRAKGGAAKPAVAEMDALVEQRRSLVDAIAALDREFDTGVISRERYAAARAGLRTRLTDVAMLINKRSVAAP